MDLELKSDLELKTIEDFHLQYNSEEACADSLFAAKWPNGFSCPECRHNHAYKISTRRLPLYQCKACGRQTSTTARTIMENSRTELRKWFLCFFLIARKTKSTNAVRLQSAISVTYKTAWLMLRKIRHAMSQADILVLLSSKVQINNAAYGTPRKSHKRHLPREHPLLIGSSIIEGEHTYIKIKQVKQEYVKDLNLYRSGIETFIDQNIDPLTTDIHCITQYSNRNRFNILSHTAAIAGKWINHTFHGLGPKYLQSYMDEFCYRLNLTLANKPVFPHLKRLCATTPLICMDR